MNRYILLLGGISILSACSQPAATPAPASEAPRAAPVAAADPTPDEEEGVQTHLPPITLKGYNVEALYTGDIMDGHFNLYVKGGEVKAVRAWVGDEAATDAVVAKAEFEEDHHCAHMEMPEQIPADARLWVELETEAETLKGSTVLTPANQ